MAASIARFLQVPVLSRQAPRGFLASTLQPAAAGLRFHAFATSSATNGDTAPAAVAQAGQQAEQEGEISLVQGGARVYRRTRAEHERVFQWGIGNRFRMQSKNRYVPVHKPHPQESVVRDEYYESDNPNIVWQELNETWEVFWYENFKLNAKPFPVKKYGIERAKVEAGTFFESLKEAGRLNEKPKLESPEDGVFFDARLQGWVSFIWKDSRPQSRVYSVNKYGLEGARMLAAAKQRDPMHGVLPVFKGRGTPMALKRRSDH